MCSPAQFKTCTNCGQTKVLSEFSRRKASKDGFQFRCKNCRSKQIRGPRNIDERRRANAKYAAKNKERKAAYSKEFRKNNRKLLADRLRNWRSICDRNRNQQTIDLTDGYVAHRIFRGKGVSVRKVPIQLIEMKRACIQVQRATRQLLKEIKEVD